MRKEIRFGIFALIAITMIVVGLNYLAGSTLFGPPMTLRSRYPTANGLLKGNPVTLNGVAVGRVSSLTLDQDDFQALVTMSFTNELAIPDNAEAMIYSSDLLGSKAVRIILPGDEAPGPALEDGAEIQGTMEKGIFEMAGGLVENEGVSMLRDINALLDSVQIIVDAAKAAVQSQFNQRRLDSVLTNIDRTTAHLAVLTGNLAAASGDFDQIIGNIDSLTTELADNREEIGAMISNLKITTDSLAASSGNIKHMIVSADSAMSSVGRMTAKLDSGEGSLGKLLNDPSLYDSLTATTAAVNDLVRDFRRRPQRYFDDIKIYLQERRPPKEKKKK